MHDIKYFESHKEEVIENFKIRGLDFSVVELALKLNNERKQLVGESESKRSQVKSLSKEIGALKSKGQDAQELMDKVATLKASQKTDATRLEEVEIELKNHLMGLPNLVDSSVPAGTSEEDNLVVDTWGEKPQFDFDPKDHVDLGTNLGMLDFDRAAKISGSRFAVLHRGLAQMERALINFMLDEHTKAGLIETIPPFLVGENAMEGTGQLPKFADDSFRINNFDKIMYLIPTSEVPLTNLRREELFDNSELPIQYCAYTPCFRSEAGSYGRDTRGLIRLHQFNKVEMVYIVDPEKSEEAHEHMRSRAEAILQALELPYQVVLLCGGDIGFGAKKCYDFEVWLPAQNTYREISSVSNCGDFQARRASIRFRDSEGRPQFTHTLNGSGLAVGRTLVAIMENYQQEDGSIRVPKVLQNYMGGKEVISR